MLPAPPYHHWQCTHYTIHQSGQTHDRSTDIRRVLTDILHQLEDQHLQVGFAEYFEGDVGHPMGRGGWCWWPAPVFAPLPWMIAHLATCYRTLTHTFTHTQLHNYTYVHKYKWKHRLDLFLCILVFYKTLQMSKHLHTPVFPSKHLPHCFVGFTRTGDLINKKYRRTPFSLAWHRVIQTIGFQDM